MGFLVNEVNLYTTEEEKEKEGEEEEEEEKRTHVNTGKV